MWKAVKRTYYGADEVHRSWIVIQEGETRGICECGEEDHAKCIAMAMNCWNQLGFGFQPLENEGGAE